MIEITVNNKRYTVNDHALKRMLQRNLSEAMLVKTMEAGTMTYQEWNDRDVYEYDLESDDESVTLKVIVDESNRVIVTIMTIQE